MPSESREVILAASEILDYFQRFPNAADSADGIRKWWLVRSRVEVSEDVVEQALNYLCRRGEVIQTLRQSGIAIYSCSKSTKGSMPRT